MEKKIEEINKKFEFVLNMCDKFPDDMDLRHVVKTLKNDVTEILKEQPANPSPSSLPTDEEMPKFNHYMTSVDSSDIDYNDVGYYVDKSGFDSAVKKAYELGLRTNFSSEKCDWISVEDRLPEVNENNEFDKIHGVCNRCITYSKEWGVRFGQFFKLAERWNIDNVTSSEGINVTHWQPLPNPPKQEQQTTK